MDFEAVKKYKNIKHEDLSYKSLYEPNELLTYLYSGAIFRLDQSERKSLLENLKTNYLNNDFKLMFDYIDFSFLKADEYWRTAIDSSRGLYAEDILSQIEFFGSRMLAKNISIDGKEYNDDIINSQHDFLLGLMPTLLRFIQNNKIPFLGKQSCGKKNQSRKLIESISHYHSIFTQLNEVTKGGYLTKPLSFLLDKYNFSNESKEILEKHCQFFMQRLPEDLDSQETYRDLNYRLEYKEEEDFHKQSKLMEDSGFAKHHMDIDLLHFDFARSEDYETEIQFHKVGTFLEQVYYSCETSFIYNQQEYKIIDLIEVSKSIYEFAYRLHKRNLNNLTSKKSSFITIKGKNSLFRDLNVGKYRESLVTLFTASSNKDIENSPILHLDNLYYIFPQHIVEFCFEKSIDKILSNKNIKLQLPKGIKKGHLFEDRILDIFSSSGIKSHAIKGNPNKGMPEIDALVELDEDNVLVIEAKCTIKPESRFEAFSFLENHMQKAIDQLTLRVDFLVRSSRSELQHHFPFRIEGKKFTPIIVTNHSYFTGMKIQATKEIDIYCIDEYLLNKIVKKRSIPSWTYIQAQNSYAVENIKLKDSHEIINAIKNPVYYLNSKANRTVQILEYGVAFEISKHSKINWEYKYNKEMQRMA